MYSNFEYRLHQLGQSVNKLKNETNHLQNLFDICLQDYEECKLHKFPKNTSKTKRQNNLLSTPINGNPQAQNIVVVEKELQAHKGILDGNTISQMGKRDMELSEDIKTEFDIAVSNLKRSSPESYNNSVVIDDAMLVPQKYGKKYVKSEAVFSTFTKAEKDRIYYDKTELGLSMFERKWGINHKILIIYGNKISDELTREGKEQWKSTQKEKLKTLMKNMDLEELIRKTEERLQQISPPRTLECLCNTAFEKGIGVAAARHKINLFQLEFLLQNMTKEKWGEMEGNKWYCINVKMSPLHTNILRMEDKLDIARFSEREGVLIASKKLGMDKATICKFRKLLVIEQNNGTHPISTLY